MSFYITMYSDIFIISDPRKDCGMATLDRCYKILGKNASKVASLYEVKKRNKKKRVGSARIISENAMNVQNTTIFKHFRKSAGLILLKFANGFVQIFTALNVSGSGMTKQHSIANFSMGL